MWATNTFIGTTTFLGYHGLLQATGSFGLGNVLVNINSAGTLYMSTNYHYTFDYDIEVTNGNFQYNGTGGDCPNNSLTLTGALNVAANATVQVRAGGVFEVSRGTIAGRIHSNNNATYVRITKISSDVLTLTYTGANTTFLTGWIIKEGFVNFNSTANLGADGKTTLDGGGLQWAAGTTTNVSAKLDATLGAAGGTFDTNGNDVTISTALTGTGGVTKTGAGTLTLTGTTNYTGETVVADGTLAFSGGKIDGTSAVKITGGELQVTNASQINATAAILVSDGQLALGASISNTIDVEGAGVLSATGTLSTGNIAIHDGGTLLVSGSLELDAGGNTIELDGANLAFDLTAGEARVTFANGRLAAGSTANIQFDENSGNRLLVLGVDESMLRTWTVNNVAVDSQYTWADDGLGGFTLVAVPEPSTYALFGGLGALAIALLRRRRSQSKA